MVYGFLRACATELFPARCLLCRAPAASGLCDACTHQAGTAPAGCLYCLDRAVAPGTVCLRCQSRPPPWRDIHAAMAWAPDVRALVHALKSRHQLSAARVLAVQFTLRCRPARPECLVAVPSHRRRLLERGFNPAALIAGCLGGELGLPVARRWLIRRRDDPPQAQLTAARRIQGPAGAFRARGAVAGRHLALVDDVLTTGSTARACVTALNRAGARRVDVWVVARA